MEGANKDQDASAALGAHFEQDIVTAKELKEWMKVDKFDDSKSCAEHVHSACGGVQNACKCSKECLIRRTVNWFPIIDAFRTYQMKKFLLSDLIAGLTVGIMHIPQGMGFALLAGLPPVIGLYTSFFPVIMYFFFTPSRSTSFGSQSLVCLMLGSLLEQECLKAGYCSLTSETTGTAAVAQNNSESYDTTAVETTPQFYDLYTAAGFNESHSSTVATPGGGTPTYTPDMQFKISLAVTISFLIGVIQMVMSLFRLGVISIYFSVTFISACNCGAAFQIATTQIKFLLGLTIPPPSGRFGLAKTWIAVFKAWRYINIADLVASCISILTMVLVKKFINERYKDRLKIPVPIEIIIVVLSTAIAKFANLSELVGLNVVGIIPQGIPPPAMPALTEVKPQYVFDSIPVALIGFLSAVLMAQMFANKYDYKVDINQELFANGIANAFSSFFTCFPSSVAPPRTMLFDSVGGRTQIAYIFSCVLVLLVLILIGPLFQTLPTAVLASIIVVALIPLFAGIRDASYLWKVNKLDFLVWIGTISSVVILDLGPGIIIGVFLSIISVVLHTQSPKAYSALPVHNSEVYLGKEVHDAISQDSQTGNAINDHVVVFKFDCPLYYANYECFVNKLTSILMPYIVDIKQTTQNGDVIDTNANNKARDHEMKPLVKEPPRLVVVLDFSAIHYVDVVGIKALKVVHRKLSAVGMKVVIAECSIDVLKTLERGDVLSLYSEENVFFKVHDAVLKFR